jgi:hypothetical protein
MKLTYRGVSYEYTPPTVETSSAPTVGKYRGLDVRFRNPKKPLVMQSTLDLVYRGVAYKPGEAPAATAPASSEPAAAPAFDRARALMMNHHRGVKRRQQAMLGRLVGEVGLTTDVSKYWNHIQGKVHPSFWATYDRSRAALS